MYRQKMAKTKRSAVQGNHPVTVLQYTHLATNAMHHGLGLRHGVIVASTSTELAAKVMRVAIVLVGRVRLLRRGVEGALARSRGGHGHRLCGTVARERAFGPELHNAVF